MPPLTDHFAIAIGIDTYPSLRRLTSAVRDATAFLEWVTDDDGGNVDPENVRLIRSPDKIPADRFDATPVQDQIDRALRDFGAEAGHRIGKRLYFYFAGHGLGPKFNEVGMLMAIASMNSLTKNIGLQHYRDYFHETGLFDEVVYFVDCCRDHTRGVSTSAPGFAPIVAATGRAKKVVDFVVLAAGYGDQAFAPVSTPDGERRGILTTALLEALRGEPTAVDPKARVTAASLQTYVRERVKAIGLDEKLKQEPELPQDLNPDLVFRQVDPATLPSLRVHVVAVTASSGELILRDARDTKTDVERHDVAKATEANPWAIKVLTHTRYEIESSASGKIVVLDPAKATEEPFVFKF